MWNVIGFKLPATSQKSWKLSTKLNFFFFVVAFEASFSFLGKAKKLRNNQLSLVVREWFELSECAGKVNGNAFVLCQSSANVVNEKVHLIRVNKYTNRRGFVYSSAFMSSFSLRNEISWATCCFFDDDESNSENLISSRREKHDFCLHN